MIGSEGIVVEIDEPKFHNPHTDDPHINAQVSWVFGSVERIAERHVFIEHIENQSANTLLAIIHHRVYPGSIILSDCWKAYDNIQSELGLKHWQVNHSHTFVDPLTGAHTNTIEGTVMTITFIYYDLPLFPFIFKTKTNSSFLLGLVPFLYFCDNHFYLNIPNFSLVNACLVFSFLLSIYSPIKCLNL